jgi:hypothetical protein
MIRNGENIYKVPFRKATDAEVNEAKKYFEMYLTKYPAECKDPDNIYIMRTLIQHVMATEEQWRADYEDAVRVMNDDFYSRSDPDRVIAEYVIKMYEATHPSRG